jgi:hypothetical protein
MCRAVPDDGGAAYPVYGGCTVILGPDGALRYVVSKSVLGAGRTARRAQFLAGALGRRFWQVEQGEYRMKGPFFRALHDCACGV